MIFLTVLLSIHGLEMIEKRVYHIETLNILKTIEQIEYPLFMIVFLWNSSIASFLKSKKMNYYVLFVITYGDNYHIICDYVNIMLIFYLILYIEVCLWSWKLFLIQIIWNLKDNYQMFFQDYQNQFIYKIKVILKMTN